MDLLQLIAPEHSYTSCSDEDLANVNRICTRCHFLAIQEGWGEPAEEYGVIIIKKRGTL